MCNSNWDLFLNSHFLLVRFGSPAPCDRWSSSIPHEVINLECSSANVQCDSDVTDLTIIGYDRKYDTACTSSVTSRRAFAGLPMLSVDAVGFTSRLLLAIHSSTLCCMVNWIGLFGITAAIHRNCSLTAGEEDAMKSTLAGHISWCHQRFLVGAYTFFHQPIVARFGRRCAAPPCHWTLLFLTAKQKELLRNRVYLKAQWYPPRNS